MTLVFIAVNVFALAIRFGAQFMLGESNTAWEAQAGRYVFGTLVSLAFPIKTPASLQT